MLPKNWLCRFAVLLFCLVIYLPPLQPQKLEKVAVNLGAKEFEDRLPYEIAFFIVGKIDPQINAVYVKYKSAKESTYRESTTWKRSYVEENEFLIKIGDGLKPYIDYEFLFVVQEQERKAELPPLVTPLEEILVKKKLAHDFEETEKHETFKVTPQPKFGPDQNPYQWQPIRGKAKPPLEDYFNVDIGFGVAPRAGIYSFFTSAQLYFKPVNKQKDIRDYKGSEVFWKRTAVFIGFTVKNFDAPEKFRSFFGDVAVVFGISFRGMTFLPFKNFHGMDGLRINVGGILFKEVDEMTIPSKEHLKVEVLIGGSLDLDLKKLLGPIAAIAGF